MSTTRRDFLTRTTLALAGVVLHGATAGAQPRYLSKAQLALTPNALLPEPITAEALRGLALHALNAAKSAGVQYADVRVAQRQEVSFGILGGVLGNVSLTPQFMYGIRVVVDGAVAFIHGSVPDADALATAARNAVVTARGYAKSRANIGTTSLGIAPAPVVKGEWETPIVIDPFKVSVMDQLSLLLALSGAAHERSSFCDVSFDWLQETRVFGSTDGSLVTQILRTAQPNFTVGADKLVYAPNVQAPVVLPMSGGYECVSAPELQDVVKESAERIAVLASLPRGTMDVGRYPVIFDGATLGAVVGQTLGVALELDRVLGYEVGAGGSSFLSPPQDVLGTMIASPALSVTSHRTLPSITAVRWDDDGVATNPVPLIEQGRLRNYCASRDTVHALRAISPATEVPLSGTVFANDADHNPRIRPAHVVVTPTAETRSIGDLCHGVTHGLLIQNVSYLMVDPQLSSGFVNFEQGAACALEISRGKIVRRLEGNGLQFATTRFWKNLLSVGDTSTVSPTAIQLYKGQPEAPAWQTASAPAGFFKEIDVVQTRR